MTVEARHAARRPNDLSRRSGEVAKADLSRRSAEGAKAEVGARHAAHLRALNLERVLAFAIEQPGPFARAEVIQATGLSAPTVGTLCAHLIRNGVVADLGTGPSRGG